MKRTLLLTTLLAAFSSAASAWVYRVAQMNTEQISALDKQKTVAILSRWPSC